MRPGVAAFAAMVATVLLLSASGGKVEVYELRPAAGSVHDTKAVYNGVESPSPAVEELPPPHVVEWGEGSALNIGPYSLFVLLFRL